MSEFSEPLSSVTDPERRLADLWREGKRPSVREFLAGAGDLSQAQILAVLVIDQHERWYGAERVLAENYLEAYPAIAADLESAIELVYGEYLLRVELGETPPQAEYVQRFPQYAERLRQQFFLRSALEKSAAGALSGPSGNSSDPTLAESLVPAGARALPRMPGYEMQSILGQGGMGIVYLAWHQELQRQVALKVIRPGAEADFLERFHQEGRAVARLQHQHIVQVYEVGQHEGRPFMALEYVDGGNLAHHLKEAILPGRNAADLVRTLAQAIHYAHQRGIIHRDLKPGNILLQTTESADKSAIRNLQSAIPKITDFGLAKMLAGEAPNQTRTSQILGTPSYMAPEQAAGGRGEIGPRTDVYALGAILYEALTGRPPFMAETYLDILQQVVHEEPVAPSRLQRKVPRDLETICLKCLRKEPARRYATAQELADDLERYLTGQPITARPVSRPERLLRWARRNPGLAALSGSTLLLLLLVAGISLTAAIHLKAALGEADAQKILAQTAEKAAEKDALRAAKAAAIATDALGLGRRERFKKLDAIRLGVELGGDKLTDKDRLALRNAALACLILPDVKLEKEWDPGGLGDPVFDHQFRRYALADVGGKVSIRSLTDHGELLRLDGHGLFDGWGCEFSPDDRYFGYATKERVRVWDLAKPKPVMIVNTLGRAVAFRPDSKQVAVTDLKGNSTRLIDLLSGKEVRRLAVRLIGPGYHPRLPHLAGIVNKTVRIVNVETGEVVVKGFDLPTDPYWLSWHPQGRLLAVSGDGKIYLVNPDSGGLAMPPLEGDMAIGLRHAFSQGGDLLGSNDLSGVLRFWDVKNGRQVFRMPMAGWPRFLRNDTVLAGAYEGSKLKVYQLASGREQRIFLPPGPGDDKVYTDALSSPDGRLLIVNTLNGLAIVDLVSGAQLAWQPRPSTKPLGFDPEGALLTATESTVERWPIVLDLAKNLLRIGPPLQVAKGSRTFAAASKDGKVIALPRMQFSTQIWRQGKPSLDLKPWQNDVRNVALSPDGRWVVTGSHLFGGLGVWEADTGKRIQALILVEGGHSHFSPDGRWLAAIPFSGGECRLWHVGAWKPGPLVQADECLFSPDCSVLAVSTKMEIGVIRLVETTTGKELARLEIPEATWLIPRCFTPDGATLIAYGKESKALHVFDLRLLRRQLRDLGLDWPGVGYPPAPAPVASPTVVLSQK